MDDTPDFREMALTLLGLDDDASDEDIQMAFEEQTEPAAEERAPKPAAPEEPEPAAPSKPKRGNARAVLRGDDNY